MVVFFALFTADVRDPSVSILGQMLRPRSLAMGAALKTWLFMVMCPLLRSFFRRVR